MRGAAILNSRKRVIVALAHSVAFLAIATFGLRGSIRPFHVTLPLSAWILPAVYMIVSGVLGTLTAFARASLERLYFAFCTTSAGFGFVRQILGDPPMHAAVYIRIVMLACAVASGTLMLRQREADLQPTD